MVSVRLLEQLAMWSCSLIRLNEKNVSWLEDSLTQTCHRQSVESSAVTSQPRIWACSWVGIDDVGKAMPREQGFWISGWLGTPK